MAKRVNKTESSKLSAAVRRTKKTKTATKKAPVKKTAKAPVKKVVAKKAPAKKAPVKKTVTTSKKTTTPKRKLADVKKVLTIVADKSPAQLAVRPVTKRTNKLIKFIRIEAEATKEQYDKMGERIKAGELQWIYYAIDGDKAYHYYKKIK